MASGMPSTMPGTCSTILEFAKAHVVGLSQGAFATAHFGRTYPDRALSLTLAGVGSGAGPEGHEQFKKDAATTAARIRSEGMAAYARASPPTPPARASSRRTRAASMSS